MCHVRARARGPPPFLPFRKRLYRAEIRAGARGHTRFSPLESGEPLRARACFPIGSVGHVEGYTMPAPAADLGGQRARDLAGNKAPSAADPGPARRSADQYAPAREALKASKRFQDGGFFGGYPTRQPK